MKQLLLLVMLCCVTFTIYYLSLVTTQTDSKWSTLVAMSLLKEGNTNLDEYKSILAQHKYNGIEKVNGHLYSIFPIGVSLIAVPFVYIATLLTPSLVVPSITIEVIVSSLAVSVAATFMYLITWHFLRDEFLAMIGFIVFAFCSPAWSTATRALWQHGPSMLMLAITLYLLILVKKKPYIVPFIGLFLAFSYIIRPTNSISIGLFSLYILLEYPRYFFRYGIVLLLTLVPFFLFNTSIYGNLLPTYYDPHRLGSNPHFIQALLANIISPGRGLFTFSPVFILCIYGVYLQKKIDNLTKFIIGIISIHWIIISSFPHWWAGASIGPRFFSDMIPYLTYLLIPVLKEIQQPTISKRRLLSGTLFTLVTISFVIQFVSANNQSVFDWNDQPVNIDIRPQRVWNWHDFPFLRI